MHALRLKANRLRRDIPKLLHTTPEKDKRHASPPPSHPPPPYSPPSSPSPRTQPLSGDVELGIRSDGVRHRHAEEHPRSEEDKEAEVRTESVDEDNIAILQLFMDDYRRTKEYVRELEWRVAVRKALRRHLYSEYGPCAEAARTPLTHRVVCPRYRRYHDFGAFEYQTRRYRQLHRTSHAAHQILAGRLADSLCCACNCIFPPTGRPRE